MKNSINIQFLRGRHTINHFAIHLKLIYLKIYYSACVLKNNVFQSYNNFQLSLTANVLTNFFLESMQNLF